ncbi:MAG: HDOD domain-containing protein [Nevskiales bacterium]|nr:HDOD domain-containing protein [Nevskiales bacterium]
MAIEDRFYRIVVDALAHDRLTLPTLPEVALKIRRLLQNEDVTSAQVAAEVHRDPAIAVRLIRVANSAAMRSGRQVENVQQAVTRLGLHYTRLLVDGLALEQMFVATHAELKKRLLRAWQQSVEVAALAQVLAAQCTLLQPEMAMLAGLVHHVGALPILRLAEHHAAALESAEALDDVVARLSPRIGRMVLQAWHFPPELVDVPVLWPDMSREHDGGPDFADVVAVAVLRTRGASDPQFRDLDAATVPAFVKLDLEPDFPLSGPGSLAEGYQSSLQLLQAA